MFIYHKIIIEMKRFFLRQPVLFILTILFSQVCFAQVNDGKPLQKVVIIRHGEKPETGENLSCQGLNRSIQLANVLYAKFKIPDYIFVPSIKTGKSTGQIRMYQTITPFAVKYNLNIDTKYMVNDAPGLAASILKKSGTILVVWEHNNIPQIVQALGVKDYSLKWKGDDFDSIWIITFKNGKAVLTPDKENLNPSTACN